MRITKNQLKRLIKEEAHKLAKKKRKSPMPMKSRATPEVRAAISNSEMQKHLRNSTQNSINEAEYYYGAGDLELAIKEVMSILQGMNPMDRNPEIYQLIDDLENLASRG